MREPPSKIRSYEEAKAWRASLRASGQPLVMTNGCFDLLHRGHVEYLNQARREGAALVVAINSDESLRTLKGPARPVVAEHDRAFLLGALECVDAVVVMQQVNAIDLLELLVPDVYVKGGDYTEETLNRDEYTVLKRLGIRIRLLSFIPGYSTSQLIAKIKYDEATPPRERK